VWKAVKTGVSTKGPWLELNYLSKDKEEGFPGNLNVTAVYSLTDDNELKVEFVAKTDKPTIANLTQHSYFNLAGQGKGDILGHLVYINANQTTPVDSGLITTGEFADVTGTPFDFRKPTAIGARINDADKVLQYGPGYDHNWVINKPLGQFGLQARVVEPVSGRVMEVWSDRTRSAILRRQFPGRHPQGQGRRDVSAPHRFCHGTAALSRFPEQGEFPVGGTQARPDLPQHHRLQVQRGITGAGLFFFKKL
jgi:aldose 1-epimerase